jgi:hypothetical protein
MNYFDEAQHRALAESIQMMNAIAWIISYDAKPEILKLYQWVKEERVKNFELHHYAYKKRVWKEILLFSDCLRLDTDVNLRLAKMNG